MSLDQSWFDAIKQYFLQKFGWHIVYESPIEEYKNFIIAKEENGQEIYIKIYTPPFKAIAEKEVQITQRFGEFIKDDNDFSPLVIFFSWAENDCVYYAMEKLATMVQFQSMKTEDMYTFYKKYRSVFDKFEEYTEWLCSNDSTSSKADLAMYFWQKLEERYTHGYPCVAKYIPEVASLTNLLSWIDFDELKDYPQEYCFGHLWSGGVFEKEGKYILLDFGHVGYKHKYFEIIELMWDNLLLNVKAHTDRDAYFLAFEERKKFLLEFIPDRQLSCLLKIKLIGTVFEDWGNLMQKRNASQEDIEKWILRNYELLKMV